MWVLLNAAVHSSLFEFCFISANLSSLPHFLSFCLLIFRPSISFYIHFHLCHILLFSLYIPFQVCISLSALPYMKYDSLTLKIGTGPCYPAWAYVFFDVSFGKLLFWFFLGIFYFSFRNLPFLNPRQKDNNLMDCIYRSICCTIIVSYILLKLSTNKVFFSIPI